jgi:hypothetical protein
MNLKEVTIKKIHIKNYSILEKDFIFNLSLIQEMKERINKKKDQEIEPPLNAPPINAPPPQNHWKLELEQKTKNLKTCNKHLQQKTKQCQELDLKLAEMEKMAKESKIREMDLEEKSSNQLLIYKMDLEEKSSNQLLKVQEKSNQLDVCQRDLEEQTKQLDVCQRDLEEQTKQLDVCQMQLQEKTNQLKISQSNLEEKANQLGVYQIQLQEKTNQLNVYQIQLQEKTNQLNVYQMELQEKTNQLKISQSNLEEQSKQLGVCQMELQEKTNHLNVCQIQLQEKARESIEKKSELNAIQPLLHTQSIDLISLQTQLKMNQETCREHIHERSLWISQMKEMDSLVRKSQRECKELQLYLQETSNQVKQREVLLKDIQDRHISGITLSLTHNRSTQFTGSLSGRFEGIGEILWNETSKGLAGQGRREDRDAIKDFRITRCFGARKRFK